MSISKYFEIFQAFIFLKRRQAEREEGTVLGLSYEVVSKIQETKQNELIFYFSVNNTEKSDVIY